MLFFAGISIGLVRTLVDAWGLWVLWGWFVEPLGAPSISYAHAVGLDLIVGFLLACAARRSESDDHASDLGFGAAKVIIAPFCVAIGWVVQGFM